MIISIHQPNFIPWTGYFYKMSRSDAFVFLDDVQYTKNSFINRNRIKTPQGPQWLTLPVKKSGTFGDAINQMEINQPEKAMEKADKTLEQNYRKAPFFREFHPDFMNILHESSPSLSLINMNLIQWISKMLGIQAECYVSGELPSVEGNGTDRLVSICNMLGGDVYFSGFGGTNYQEEQKFTDQGIRLQVSDFNHPVYPQLWGDFEPNLSIIDLLYNEGSGAGRFFRPD